MTGTGTGTRTGRTGTGAELSNSKVELGMAELSYSREGLGLG